MAEVKWTIQSIEDISNIAEYISNDSVRYAEMFVEKVFERAEILNSHSHAARMVPEIEDKTIRELILGNYRIIYKIYPSRIDVLTVHHSARPIENSSLFEK